MRLLAVVLFVACIGAPAAELHVSLQENGTNTGTEAAPFGSLVQAREAIRVLKAGDGLPDGGVTVWVHEGAYELSESFELTEKDSGTVRSPVVYRAVPGHEVRLIGGRTIPSEAFAPPSDDSALSRIDPDARDSVLAADLTALSITELGQFPDRYQEPPVVPELFCDGQRMTLAGWPNDGWAHVAKVIESGPAPWRNHQSDQPGTFEYDGDRPSRWLDAPGVWLHGYWCFDWRAETILVKEIDTGKRHITFVKPHCYGLGHGNPPPRRYRAENLLEELDMPGEYYIDRQTATLYFWPPSAINDADVVLSTLPTPVVTMTDVSFVTLQGITIEACCEHGIEMRGGDSNRVIACTVRYPGHDGIIVDEGKNHRVIACDIHDTGRAGLRIGGGDRKTLTPCGHEAVNNHIYRVSRRQRTGAYHVHLKGVGVRMAHNLVHHAPHQSINIMGNDHIVEYNEIHHSGQDSDDCGAFYMGRNPSERGSILRHNFWHHIGSSRAHGSCAVYFDDGSGGQTVYGNVFYKAAGGTFGAVFVHGGHQNIVDNNVFVDCKLAIRQAPWKDAAWVEYLEDEDRQNKLLRDVDITKPPYLERYPELEDYMVPSGEPRLNYASHNIIYKCEGFVQGNWVVYDNVVTDRNPGFTDIDNLDFKLSEKSQTVKSMEQFKVIPFNHIGLVTDQYRTELPDDPLRNED
jgi:hypothetical protein